jgi:hypothetical protein
LSWLEDCGGAWLNRQKLWAARGARDIGFGGDIGGDGTVCFRSIDWRQKQGDWTTLEVRSFTEAEEPPAATFHKVCNHKFCLAILYGSDITVFIDRARARDIGPTEEKVEFFLVVFRSRINKKERGNICVYTYSLLPYLYPTAHTSLICVDLRSARVKRASSSTSRRFSIMIIFSIFKKNLIKKTKN